MIARAVLTMETLYILVFVLLYIFLLAIYTAILRFIPIFQEEQGKLNLVGNFVAILLSMISFFGILKMVA